MQPKIKSDSSSRLSHSAKLMIVLVPFAIALVGATVYQWPKLMVTNATTTAATPHGEKAAEIVQPIVQGEPFSAADGVVNSANVAASVKNPQSKPEY